VCALPCAASQDYNNNRFRRIDLATGVTTTLVHFPGGTGNIAIASSGTFALFIVRPPAFPPARSHKHLLSTAPSRISPNLMRRVGRALSHRHVAHLSRAGFAAALRYPPLPPPRAHSQDASSGINRLE
jgi:hypothetical protein